MKVVIIRNAPSGIKQLMAAQFPGNWEIVIASVDEIENAIGDAEAIIPEGAAIDRRVLALAPRLKFIRPAPDMTISILMPALKAASMSPMLRALMPGPYQNTYLLLSSPGIKTSSPWMGL